MTTHDSLLNGSEARHRGNTARNIANALDGAGYLGVVADHEYAVKVLDAATCKQVCIVWLPVGERVEFNDLGFKYLWGPTGDEHQAEDSTGVDELVRLIVATLPTAVAE